MLAPGTEGGWTTHVPTGEKMFIYDASVKYQKEGTPLLIIAGKEYGSGSSRDWAAKGTLLLGVRAVIAESFERIHRSNLVGMGVLPMQFLPGENRESLGLTGFENYAIEGIPEAVASGAKARVWAKATRARRPSKLWCGSIRRRKPSTIATAGFCRTWCGNWRNLDEEPAQSRTPHELGDDAVFLFVRIEIPGRILPDSAIPGESTRAASSCASDSLFSLW